MRRSLIFASIVMLFVPAFSWSQQQASTPPSAEESLQNQVLRKLADMQAQIDALKAAVAARDQKIQVLTGDVRSTPIPTVSEASSSDAKPQRVSAAIPAVQASVAQTSMTPANQEDHNASIHYKGVTLTPGGFLAGESIWRQRAMNADIYTNFNATPYMNLGEAHTSGVGPLSSSIKTVDAGEWEDAVRKYHWLL